MKENMTVRVFQEIRKALDKKAEDEDRSLSYVVNMYLKRCLVEEGYLKEDMNK